MVKTTRRFVIFLLAVAMAAGGIGVSGIGDKYALAAGAIPQPLPRKDCFFGLHFDIHAKATDQNLGSGVSEENLNQLIQTARPDFIQWDLKGAFGYASYPTRVGTPAPGIVKDALPILRKVTRQHGVGLYGYYCGLSDQVAVAHHPEWAHLDALGRSDKISLSTFSTYTTQLMIPQMNEAASLYGLDGFWVDAQCLSAGLDYSAGARLAWLGATHQTSPPTLTSDASWFAWKQFNRQQFINHLNTWVGAVHSHSPNVQIASNWTFSVYAPEPVTSRVDFLTGDFSYADGLDTPRLQARYLSNAGVAWDLMAWGFVHAGPSNYWVLPSDAVRQDAATVIMQGGAFEIYHHPAPGGFIPNEIIQQAGDVAAFCRARQAVSFKSISVPQVALLLSTQTYFDRCQSSFVYKGQWPELEGVLHGLLEAHYSVDVLSEVELQPRLAQFPLVVVPDSYRLAPDFLAALLKYVQNGGNLLVIGAKCAPTFGQALNVTFNGPPVVLPGYVPTSIGLAAVPGYWVPVTANPGAQVIDVRYPTADFHAPNPQIAATLTRYGTGQILAMYGPIAVDYQNNDGNVYLRQWLADSVRRLFPGPAVSLDGPPIVDLSLRHTHDGKLCVHLLNRTPLATNPPQPGSTITPVGPMTLRVKVGRKPSTVTWVPGEVAMKGWTWANGTLSVPIESLAIHGVVVIQ